MLGSEAVARIQEGLGFATRRSDTILARMKEAQRDFEKGKTLPKFLLQEDQALTLLSGAHSVALPTDFLRVDDDALPRFTDSVTLKPTFISIVRSYSAAVAALAGSTSTTPRTAVIRQSTIDFIIDATQTYTFTWNYYKADAEITLGAENLWLANAADWIIGEAGYRMAKNARDQAAMADFGELRTQGRAAVFGEIIASEEAAGPVAMGEDL